MKYFVVSDIHSFFDEFMLALNNAGYFSCNEEKKLIVVGDLLDRGPKPIETVEFISSLMDKDEVILVKGNHEDLYEELIDNFEVQAFSDYYSYHYSNGTIMTAYLLAGMTYNEMKLNPKLCKKRNQENIFYTKIIPSMLDYYETDNYIFTHGFIPVATNMKNFQDAYYDGWRTMSSYAFEEARWANGMEQWFKGLNCTGKTIVCGHWHCSYGNYKMHNKGIGEFDKQLSCFDPFIDDGIIAIDASTAVSGKVNCVVVED